MELQVIKPTKKYEHTFEACEGSPEDILAISNKIKNLFAKPCQRILMIQCPQIGEETFNVDNARMKRYPCFPPYGPCLLVRILEDNGYDADIVDLDYEVIYQAQITEQYDFRLAWQNKLESKLNDFQPDMVGISCMYNRSHSTMKAIVTFIKENYPEVIITAGGVHISLATDQVMADVPDIDFAMLYEGDRTIIIFLEVANSRQEASELAQIATNVDGRLIKITKRMLPEELTYSPDYKDLPIQNYASVGKIGAYTFLYPPGTPTGTVLSTRGCRAKCSFCSVRSVNGKGVRTRDIYDVIDEIKRLRDTYGVKSIMWLDDDLFYDGARAIELFEELANANLGISWNASNGIIAAALNPRLIKACVASGCVGFNIGIESGNPQILLSMQKPGNVGSFRRAAEYLKTAPSIFTKGFLLLLYPLESLSMLMDTVNLAIEMQMDWYPAQILTPMFNSPVFKLMEDLNILGDVPAVTLGKARTFTVGAMGSIGKREKLEKKQTKGFKNIFSGDLSRIPDRSEAEDIYFCVDFEVNYKIMLNYTDKVKINKKRLMLQEIVSRMTDDNAIGTLFLAIAEYKLDNHQEARRLIHLANKFVDESAFWQKYFEALGIDDILVEYTQLIL